MASRFFGMNDAFGLTGGPGAFRRLVLDKLSTQPRSAWSFARQMWRPYRGPVGRLYRLADGVEADVYGSGWLGLVNPAAIRAFGGWNLLRNSSNFSLGGWSSVGVAYTTGLPGPTGNSDAVKVAYNTDTNLKRFSQSVTLRVGVTYCSSIYAKADPVDTVAIRNIDSTSRIAWDLTTGSVTALVGSLFTSPTIESVGDGWFRLSFCHLATATSEYGIAWWGRSNASSTGGGVGGTLFARAQVEVGSAPTAYRATGSKADSDVLWSRVYDQTGAGRTFAQSTAALMPYAARQGIPVTENGIQSAEFVAADFRRMSVASSSDLYNFMHTTGGWAFGVSRTNDNAALKCLLRNTSSGVRAGFQITRSTTEQWTITVGRTDVAGVATDGNTVSAGTADAITLANCLVVCGVDPDNAAPGNRARIWQNGESKTFNNILSDTPFVENAQSDLFLGSTSGGTGNWDGTISEVGLAPGSLPDADRLIYEADALDLWAIA